jgi:predicted nucleic acid-binding protein
MLLFLDANVLFSAAHNPDGRAAALFTLARAGRCTLVTSPHALTEARRNLQLKYPHRLPALTSLEALITVGLEATPDGAAWARNAGLPPDDAPILAAAVQAQADLLVTGDRTHFGHLFEKSVRGVEVIPPAEALQRVLASRRRS